MGDTVITEEEDEGLEPPLTYEEERGKPMPSKNHGIIQANLIVEFAKHREFRVISELTLEVNGQSYTPDLCVYRREPADFQHDVVRRLDPPLLTVEIVSPSQGYGVIISKVDAYFQHGVGSCWMIFPPSQNITVLTPGNPPLNFASGLATDPATGVTADLAAVFS